MSFRSPPKTLSFFSFSLKTKIYVHVVARLGGFCSATIKISGLFALVSISETNAYARGIDAFAAPRATKNDLGWANRWANRPLMQPWMAASAKQGRERLMIRRYAPHLSLCLGPASPFSLVARLSPWVPPDICRGCELKYLLYGGISATR
jgi:hypothetical protein